jgi:transcriptional regulator with XRE-family HTH domain
VGYTERRTETGLTQAELAQLAGVSIRSVARLEAGEEVTEPIREAIETALAGRRAVHHLASGSGRITATARARGVATHRMPSKVLALILQLDEDRAELLDSILEGLGGTLVVDRSAPDRSVGSAD